MAIIQQREENIKTFLDLGHSRMEEIGKTMNTTVEELYERVEELAKLH